jgi:hypothetical protein
MHPKLQILSFFPGLQFRFKVQSLQKTPLGLVLLANCKHYFHIIQVAKLYFSLYLGTTLALKCTGIILQADDPSSTTCPLYQANIAQHYVETLGIRTTMCITISGPLNQWTPYNLLFSQGFNWYSEFCCIQSHEWFAKLPRPLNFRTSDCASLDFIVFHHS